MKLYTGTSSDFVEDVTRNRLSDKLRNSYQDYYGRSASPSEITSWTNSSQFVRNLIEHNKLFNNAIILEYELPYTNERIDCLLFGKGSSDNDNVVVMELKQWSKVEESGVEGNVLTFIGGAQRMVPHPSLQIRGYHFSLKDFIQIFEEKPPVNLASCAYCHNYEPGANDVLLSPQFLIDELKEFPVYTKNDFERIGTYLKEKLGNGKGLELFNRFVASPIRPSKKLLEHTREMIKGNHAFSLIDEQITAYNTIMDRAKKRARLKTKSIIIVRGGPGTGKSVIALNVLAELLSKGHVVFHATGSKAFTSTIRRIVGTRAANHFKYFNSFSSLKENEIDVLICDEAHRVRVSSNNRFTRREQRSDLPQINELMRASRLTIFFIDDYQVVRPTEIGSSEFIRKTAEEFGAEVFDFELKTQFRCSGSDGYLKWIDNTLGVQDTANRMLSVSEKMEFKIFSSPNALYDAIKKKNYEKPNSARLVAGFCWPWSDANPDGTLKEDVVIGDFRMTWEAKDESARLAPGIPKASLWAHDPNGVNQVGSIYTIQGFEFDYVGVIVGLDLQYDPKNRDWKGHPEESADRAAKRSKEAFTQLMKNTYRVLMTRGMKGCYVYFMDKATEEFFKSRIEVAIDCVDKIIVDNRAILKDSDIKEKDKYVRYLPVMSLEVAATTFGEDVVVKKNGWMLAPGSINLSPDMFIAKVVGKSMEPTVLDNSYCVFRFYKGGSRNGSIVVAASNRVKDPEAQKYTIKRYYSEKEYFDDGTWQHKKIVLRPDNKSFDDIVIKNVFPEDFKIVAEFVKTI